jgi:tetratricopeptide (TPR) repeat protein
VTGPRAGGTLPDPGSAGTLDELIEGLRLLKVWAGNPSYDTIKDRINMAWERAGRPGAESTRKATVADCFKTGRRRLNTDLVIAVVQALHPDTGYATQWRQALRVVAGEAQAASQVLVLDRLPQDLAEFTGRSAELAHLRQELHRGRQDGGAVVISAIAGMAGVGKTQLAIHAGHVLAREQPFDRVLFVNLRGFHPDPNQPPASPAAVLDGFLRVLGVPGQQVPHDLHARAAAYRDRLVGTHTLILLDNAADADQVRLLLPETPGCIALVTSRRSLAGLGPATHLTVDVFTPDEALDFLTRALPQIAVGPDPRAAARIASRCGHLPLALGLVTGHIRATPGWTLTDHANRLDERHRDRRLDTGVELALGLSYQHLSAAQQRLLRLASLHPGQDVDVHAAAALCGTDLSTAGTGLHDLHRDHLLQQSTHGRYTLHDLVRAYATGRADDQDPPPARRAALTRLFDYYLSTCAAAVDTLYPAEAYYRPRVPPPATPIPAVTDPDTARGWLDAERATLVAIAAHTAAYDWPTHTTRLATTLYRYLDGGHPSDALAVHNQARRAARRTNDSNGQAQALHGLGTAYLRLGRYGPATEHLQGALDLFRETGDHAGQARTLGTLGNIEKRLGHYQTAIDHHEQARILFRTAVDQAGEARSLVNLGVVETRLGRYQPATEHLRQALTLCRQARDPIGEADTLTNLGELEARLGRYRAAADYREQAIDLYQQVGDRASEAATLDDLGTIHTRLGQPAQATECHQRALTVFRESGDLDAEAWALNGLGEAAYADGRIADALTHHAAALTIATQIGSRDQQARAHAGLGHAHHTVNQPDAAHQHFQDALIVYTDLGMPQADQIRAHLATSKTTTTDSG